MLLNGPSKEGVDEISFGKPLENNDKEVEHSIIASTAWWQEMCTLSYFMKFLTKSLLSFISEEIKDKRPGGEGKVV